MLWFQKGSLVLIHNSGALINYLILTRIVSLSASGYGGKVAEKLLLFAVALRGYLQMTDSAT